MDLRFPQLSSGDLRTPLQTFDDSAIALDSTNRGRHFDVNPQADLPGQTGSVPTTEIRVGQFAPAANTVKAAARPPHSTESYSRAVWG